VLAFTLTVSLGSALLFGLLPALRLCALDFAALRDAGRSASDTPGRHRTRNTMVVAQVALALVLLIVSCLMIQTFFVMRQIRPGFVRPEQVQTFRLGLPAALISDRPSVPRTYEKIAERLKQVPGVSAVGLTNSIAMDGATGGTPIFVEE